MQADQIRREPLEAFNKDDSSLWLSAAPQEFSSIKPTHNLQIGLAQERLAIQSPNESTEVT